MIERVIVKKTLKADRLYIAGTVLYPPFSNSILSEIESGADTLKVVYPHDKDSNAGVVKTNKSVSPEYRKILFREFKPLQPIEMIIVKKEPRRGTSPSCFLGRYAKKKKKLLFRKFEKLPG